jgi:hypothetical protein
MCARIDLAHDPEVPVGHGFRRWCRCPTPGNIEITGPHHVLPDDRRFEVADAQLIEPKSNSKEASIKSCADSRQLNLEAPVIRTNPHPGRGGWPTGLPGRRTDAPDRRRPARWAPYRRRRGRPTTRPRWCPVPLGSRPHTRPAPAPGPHRLRGVSVSRSSEFIAPPLQSRRAALALPLGEGWLPPI